MKNQSLGARLKSLMEEKSWKTAEFLEKTGLDRGLAYRILNDQAKPNLSSITKICSGLRINADWLIFGNEPRDRLRPELKNLMSYLAGLDQDSQYLCRILSKAYFTHHEQEEASILLSSLEKRFIDTEDDPSYSIFKYMQPHLLIMFEDRHLKNVLILSRYDDNFYIDKDKNGKILFKIEKINVDMKALENEKNELQKRIDEFITLQSKEAKEMFKSFVKLNT